MRSVRQQWSARVRDVPLRIWWEATRPRMFPVWLSSGIIPAAVAWRDGVFEPITFILETLLCFLLLSLSCWADEYGDLEKGVDNDGRLGPIRPLQRGELSPEAMLRGCIALAAVICVVGLALVVWSSVRLGSGVSTALLFLAVGAVCIIAAFCYTMGKRPYGYRGWGDFVSFFFFGPVAGVGGYWLYANTMNWLVLLPSSAAGILLAQTINLQNIRDFENDAACGKRTTAVVLGRPAAIAYHYALSAAACICYVLFPVLSGCTSVWNYLFVATFPLLAKHCADFSGIVRSEGSMARIDALMWPLTRAMGICAVSFCICVML